MPSPLVLVAAAWAALGPALAPAAPPSADAQPRLADGVRVIVNPALPVQALPREQVSRVFLRKVARWDGGVPVNPVDLDPAAPARGAFTRAVHRRTVPMITGYWQRQIFSGRQLPPPSGASDADVIAYVRSTPGAIGYVSAGADVRGVRVLTVVDD